MKIRKELYFGFTLMALIIVAALAMVFSVDQMTNGHYGLLMLSLVVVAIMLGFPTAFTLMGMACCSPGWPTTATGTARWT